MATQDGLSATDARILDVLQRDGRRPYADLGADVGMSGPSAHERVKKLEARGVITGYAAGVDPAAVGLGILGFSWITQAPGTAAIDLTDDFGAIPEIEECHHISGEADYLAEDPGPRHERLRARAAPGPGRAPRLHDPDRHRPLERIRAAAVPADR